MLRLNSFASLISKFSRTSMPPDPPTGDALLHTLLCHRPSSLSYFCAPPPPNTSWNNWCPLCTQHYTTCQHQKLLFDRSWVKGIQHTACTGVLTFNPCNYVSMWLRVNHDDGQQPYCLCGNVQHQLDLDEIWGIFHTRSRSFRNNNALVPLM